jgi:hypothetical protein
MKLCPKLYIHHTIMEKIVEYPFHDQLLSWELGNSLLDGLTLVMKVIKVESFNLAMTPL